ncbi:MAG: helix-turn-helix transcriptional regulator [Clostridia bacterium]|nr:helix-turn-helix transcriptional regulator [Clostridia bacterium]
MKTINISKNIADLRKRKNITQEQLAAVLNVSPQAVSKWETGTSLPDVQILPQIADYFGVSVDYIYYGKDVVYDDIYEKIFGKVCAFEQMSEESYKEVHKIFARAHHGISKGNLSGRGGNYESQEPAHISNENGVSLLHGKGYGAIVAREFFESADKTLADFAAPLFSALGEKNCFLALMAVISMSDISFGEMQEKTCIGREDLRAALDLLIKNNIIKEKVSKHKSLGFTYEVNEMYHTCLCIILATAQMQRETNAGCSCCMGFGDYPLKF